MLTTKTRRTSLLMMSTAISLFCIGCSNDSLGNLTQSNLKPQIYNEQTNLKTQSNGAENLEQNAITENTSTEVETSPSVVPNPQESRPPCPPKPPAQNDSGSDSAGDTDKIKNGECPPPPPPPCSKKPEIKDATSNDTTTEEVKKGDCPPPPPPCGPKPPAKDDENGEATVKSEEKSPPPPCKQDGPKPEKDEAPVLVEGEKKDCPKPPAKEDQGIKPPMRDDQAPPVRDGQEQASDNIQQTERPDLPLREGQEQAGNNTQQANRPAPPPAPKRK